MTYKFTKTRTIALADRSDMIFDIEFSPERETHLAVATIEGDIFIMDTGETEMDAMIVQKFPAHHRNNPIRKVRFMRSTAPLLVSASKSLRLTDLNTGRLVRTISNNKVKIYSILPIDQSLLAMGDDEGHFVIWDIRTPRQAAYMQETQCEQYISDMTVAEDGKYVCTTSGEGTLTAFNIRGKRMSEPQSELFDSGFQSIASLESKKRVVCGAEDGALNIFAYENWGNISDRMPVRPAQTSRGSGSCSVDALAVLSDEPSKGVLLAGCSDNLLRAVSIHPNGIMSVACQMPSSIESLTVQLETATVACSSESTIQLINYEAQLEEDSDEDSVEDHEDDGNDRDKDDSNDSDDDSEPKSKRRKDRMKKRKQGHTSANNRPSTAADSFFSDL